MPAHGSIRQQQTAKPIKVTFGKLSLWRRRDLIIEKVALNT
jgi:hypothetical protein